jgi:hypothetical protein
LSHFFDKILSISLYPLKVIKRKSKDLDSPTITHEKEDVTNEIEMQQNAGVARESCLILVLAQAQKVHLASQSSKVCCGVVKSKESVRAAAGPGELDKPFHFFSTLT